MVGGRWGGWGRSRGGETRDGGWGGGGAGGERAGRLTSVPFALFDEQGGKGDKASKKATTSQYRGVRQRPWGRFVYSHGVARVG